MNYTCKKCGGPLPADMTKECPVCIPGIDTSPPVVALELLVELTDEVWTDPAKPLQVGAGSGLCSDFTCEHQNTLQADPWMDRFIEEQIRKWFESIGSTF